MKKTLKRTLALLMATASLTVSLGGMSVHAANTRHPVFLSEGT